MKSVGVIVEYNPFHNGHKYHLDETKKKTNADCVIAVMSGNFLQRGEPALVSKWARTKMALEAGIDIVVELPYAFSTQKAEVFANGAISLLEALYCDEVCFGSEDGTIDAFHQTIQFMNAHSESYNRSVKQFMKEGYSYPKASSLAYLALANDQTYIDLSKPNNILGYHYVKAIVDQKYKLKAATIKRNSANYHDETFASTTIASATSIRKALFENNGDLTTLENYIPKSTLTHLFAYFRDHNMFHNWEGYFHLLKYKLLSSSPEELSKIYEVEEGLEYRLISNIREATTFHEFMEKIKTKRYTWTRLQRVCLHILTNTLKSDMSLAAKDLSASYIRLLGMTQVGQKYLNLIKKDMYLPIISKPSAYTDQMFQIDMKASNIYLSIFPEPKKSTLLRLEFSTPPVRYNKEQNIYV